MLFFATIQYLKYLAVSRHRKGYGIHSPFAFQLVREVIYKHEYYYFYDDIDNVRKLLASDNTQLKVTDFGAANNNAENGLKTIGQIVRRSAIPSKYGKLLSRLIVRFAPRYIVELGTSVGIGTLYMALAKRDAHLVTIEGCPNIYAHAKKIVGRLVPEAVKCLNGQFDHLLPDVLENLPRLDFAFVDGNHTKEATIEYFQLLLGKVHNDTVLVFDDIHWSKGMCEAWDYIVAHPQVTVSMDLFRFGLVFFRRECQKQHYIVFL